MSKLSVLIKNIVPKQVLVFTALAVSLNIVHIVWSDSTYLLYLIWNIFLAYLPFFLSVTLLWCAVNKKMRPIFFILGGAVWLFLFPNAPYLVTDIIHVGSNSLIPVWYDAILFFNYALVGMLLGIYSLSHIEQLLRLKYSEQISSALLMVAILFSSFGIYIGRFFRWNSWDIIIQPHKIISDVWITFSNPYKHFEAYIFTLVFFVFILVFYRAWKFMNIK